MFECIVCSEDKVKAVECSCGYKTCEECIKEFILSSSKPAHCMQCNVLWTHKFLLSKFPSSWVSKTYKDHRKKILLEIEKIKIPESLALMETDRKFTKAGAEYYSAMREYNHIWYEFRHSKINRDEKEWIALGKSLAESRIKSLKLYEETRFGEKNKNKETFYFFICPCPKEECRGMIEEKTHICTICNTKICKDCREIIPKNFIREEKETKDSLMSEKEKEEQEKTEEKEKNEEEETGKEKHICEKKAERNFITINYRYTTLISDINRKINDLTGKQWDYYYEFDSTRFNGATEERLKFLGNKLAKIKFRMQQLMLEKKKLKTSYYNCPKEGCRGLIEENRQKCLICKEKICSNCRKIVPKNFYIPCEIEKEEKEEEKEEKEEDKPKEENPKEEEKLKEEEKEKLVKEEKEEKEEEKEKKEEEKSKEDKPEKDKPEKEKEREIDFLERKDKEEINLTEENDQIKVESDLHLHVTGEHVCNKDLKKNVNLMKKDTKPCPKCARPIFHYSGCLQMFCTICKTIFNWGNGKIETGTIHNPYALDWRRQQRLNGVDINQELNGVNQGQNCEGLPALIEIQDLFKNLPSPGFMQENLPPPAYFGNCFEYMARIPERMNICRGQIQNNQIFLEQKRQAFLRKEISETRWKQNIYLRIRDIERWEKKLQIYETAGIIGINEFRSFCYDHKNPKQFVVIMEHARNFINHTMEDELTILGSTQLPMIYENWFNDYNRHARY